MRTRFMMFAVATLALTACVPKADLEKQLEQVTHISAEKDSLLKDVMATSQFIADINGELSRIKAANAGKPTRGGPGELENPSPAQARAQMIERIKQVIDRVNVAESRLAASRARASTLGGDNTSLTVQLAQYDSTITAFKAIVENQKAEIAALSAQVDALQGENKALKVDKATLTTENEVLMGEKSALTVERNTVYYVIGTKAELRKKGIIVKKGGFLGIGATDIPATSLNPADFAAIDKTRTAKIALPQADKSYRVLSRQDLGATEKPVTGGYKSALRITSAEQFWGASKFLIIVRN